MLVVERPRGEQTQHLPRVLDGVERARLGVAAVAFPARVAGFLFLDLAGVLEQQRDEAAARLGAVDGALEALGDEARQQARMVEVGVGDDDRVELRRPEREGGAVALLELLGALVDAAVDEHLPLAPGEVRATAGDRAAGAVEGDPGHGIGAPRPQGAAVYHRAPAARFML